MYKTTYKTHTHAYNWLCKAAVMLIIISHYTFTDHIRTLHCMFTTTIGWQTSPPGATRKTTGDQHAYPLYNVSTNTASIPGECILANHINILCSAEYQNPCLFG